MSLSTDSIKTAIDELNRYKDELQSKQREFVSRLIERGYEVAKDKIQDTSGLHGTHRMGKYITFEKRLEDSGTDCKGILLGMGKDVLSKISAGRSINALYALEFGTAALGLPPYKGTNSFAGHENDYVWYAKTQDGEYVTLGAIAPTRPMYEAGMKMLQDIKEVAQEVFQTDRTVEC